KWQAYFRAHRPPTLVVWGRNDEIFGVAGAEAYKRDNPDAEVHLLDAGHFALESHGPRIAALIRAFLARKVRRGRGAGCGTDTGLPLLDAGHFALESHGPRIAALIRDFLGRKVRR